MKNKIEEGEYVRTKRGEICKVLGISPELRDGKRLYSHKSYYLDTKKGSLTEPFIIKHSKNIIDLIENEDCLIYKIRGSDLLRKGFVRKHIDLETNREYLSIEFYSLKQIEILEIVTKEQFNSVKYEVEEC